MHPLCFNPPLRYTISADCRQHAPFRWGLRKDEKPHLREVGDADFRTAAMGTLQSSDWRGFGFPATDYSTKNDPVDQIQNQWNGLQFPQQSFAAWWRLSLCWTKSRGNRDPKLTPKCVYYITTIRLNCLWNGSTLRCMNFNFFEEDEWSVLDWISFWHLTSFGHKF